jgi:hypothetical protein
MEVGSDFPQSAPGGDRYCGLVCNFSVSVRIPAPWLNPVRSLARSPLVSIARPVRGSRGAAAQAYAPISATRIDVGIAAGGYVLMQIRGIAPGWTQDPEMDCRSILA